MIVWQCVRVCVQTMEREAFRHSQAHRTIVEDWVFNNRPVYNIGSLANHPNDPILHIILGGAPFTTTIHILLCAAAMPLSTWIKPTHFHSHNNNNNNIFGHVFSWAGKMASFYHDMNQQTGYRGHDVAWQPTPMLLHQNVFSMWYHTN